MITAKQLDEAFEKYWTDMQEGLDDEYRDNVDIYDFIACAWEEGAQAALKLHREEVKRLRTALEAVVRSPLWVDEEMVKRALKND